MKVVEQLVITQLSKDNSMWHWGGGRGVLVLVVGCWWLLAQQGQKRGTGGGEGSVGGGWMLVVTITRLCCRNEGRLLCGMLAMYRP